MAFVYFRYSIEMDFSEWGETMKNGSKAKKRCHGWIKNKRKDPRRRQKQEVTEDNQENVEGQNKYHVVAANLKRLELYVTRTLHVLSEAYPESKDTKVLNMYNIFNLQKRCCK